MEPNISFTYEGKRYSVSHEAYDLDRIVLPDGRVLQVEAWKEISPPQPVGLREVPTVFSSNTPEDIATLMNGVVAEEVA